MKKMKLLMGCMAIGIMAMAFAGCSNPLSSHSGPSENNPYRNFANAYQSDPFNPHYAYYLSNVKVGDHFNKDREKLDAFDKNQNGRGIIVFNKEDGFFSRLFTSGDTYSWVATKTHDMLGAKSEYYYTGGLKDGKPEGLGMVYKEGPDGSSVPVEKGNFEEGKLQGYGQQWITAVFETGKGGELSAPFLEREGIYDKGYMNGEGFIYKFIYYPKKVEQKLQSGALDNGSPDHVKEVMAAAFKDIEITYAVFKNNKPKEDIKTF